MIEFKHLLNLNIFLKFHFFNQIEYFHLHSFEIYNTVSTFILISKLDFYNGTFFFRLDLHDTHVHTLPSKSRQTTCFMQEVWLSQYLYYILHLAYHLISYNSVFKILLKLNCQLDVHWIAFKNINWLYNKNKVKRLISSSNITTKYNSFVLQCTLIIGVIQQMPLTPPQYLVHKI